MNFVFLYKGSEEEKEAPFLERLLPVVVTIFVFLPFVTNGFVPFCYFSGTVLAAVFAFLHGNVLDVLFTGFVRTNVVDARSGTVSHK